MVFTLRKESKTGQVSEVTFNAPSTLRGPEEFEKAKSTGHFGFVLEENSIREIA